MTQRDIRSLQTEIGTRGRLAQLERWNVKVLALSAPSADQLLGGSFELARLARPERKVEFDAPVVLAAAPAPGASAPIGEPAADDTGKVPASNPRALFHAVAAEGGGSLISAALLERELTFTISQRGEHWVTNALAVLAAVEALGEDVAVAGLALADMACFSSPMSAGRASPASSKMYRFTSCLPGDWAGGRSDGSRRSEPWPAGGRRPSGCTANTGPMQS